MMSYPHQGSLGLCDIRTLKKGFWVMNIFCTPIWVVVAKFNSSEVLSIRISFNENLLNSLYLLNRCPFGRIDDPDNWHGFKAK